MDNIFSQFKSDKTPKQRHIGMVTKDLFTENNPHGYITREHMIEYVSGLTDYQQKKLMLFFEYLGNQYPITSLPIASEDEYGNLILWAVFRVDGKRQSFRLFSEDWLVKLVKDYTAGLLHGFQYSQEEMSEELKKAHS